MKTTRLLLPFTHGVHAQALEYGVMLAKSRGATLVPLSLIPVSNERGFKGARLEHIQQSKDFLVAVQHKANRHSVPVEPVELFTSDVVESIKTLAQDRHCDGILLFVRGGDGVLLQTHEVKHVMTQIDSKFLIVRLPPGGRKNFMQALLKHFSSVLSNQSSNTLVQH